MTCDEAARLVEAYADGELDLERSLEVEAHVAECAACAKSLDSLRALSRTLQTAPYYRAPHGLANRLRRPPRLVIRPWLTIAASLAFMVVISAAFVLHERTEIARNATMEAVIEGHVRSLMAGHLTDVASSDRHTVKPWFAGRVDFSPTVIDLASDGYPLSGGRLDYIDHHATAALVYTRRAHAINVFMWPNAGDSPSHVTRTDARGYHVISWARGGVDVWIVSDLALDELSDFARRLDGAM